MIRAVATDEDRRSQAADWLVRLQAVDLDEVDAVTFDAWLTADPANAAAYDTVLAVAGELEASAAAVLAGLQARRRARPTLRWPFAAAGLAAAIAAAVVVAPALLPQPSVASYATAAGEHRSITLVDGTKIDLNGGTRLKVVLRRGERDVRMDEGQAVFDVAADKTRPFLIAVGDRTVRVVGTQFDVRRRAGEVSVTVTRGVVQVSPSGDVAGQAFRLHPGQRLEHDEGAAAVRISAVSPEQALGWRAGKLVYRNQPLSQVVADLDAQFATPCPRQRPGSCRYSDLWRPDPRRRECSGSSSGLARFGQGGAFRRKRHPAAN